MAKRTYKLIVETSSDYLGMHPYLVTLSDSKRGVIVEQNGKNLKTCMAAVVGRIIADDTGAE
jgi:hypothetical protein